jgi:hypothetical protein
MFKPPLKLCTLKRGRPATKIACEKSKPPIYEFSPGPCKHERTPPHGFGMIYKPRRDFYNRGSPCA